MLTLRNLMIAAVVGVGAMLFAPQETEANGRYWNNYWSWYDNDYRPYYNRRYNNYRYDQYNRQYYRPYDDYYGRNYYGRDYYDRNYYGRDYYRDGGSVGIGPFQLRWR